MTRTIHRIQVVVTGKDGQRLAQYTLVPGEYFIGRASGCQIQLSGPNVSRNHARLLVSARQVLLEDLGSTHGTFVAGERLVAPMALPLPCTVQAGDGRLEIRSADEPSSEIATASVLQGPKYRVGVTIAQGGMGVVLNAEDVRLGRSVAMKRMLGRGAVSSNLLRRFVREAQVLGRLEHPNIVPIHDLGLDEQGEVFYTMKFVQGRTLHTVLESIRTGNQEDIAAYPLSHLLTVFQKVCDAVAFAHSKGVIHRDLKPANIMLGEFGEVLVMDWGLAKILYAGEEEPAPSSSDAALPKVGTPADGLTMPGAILGTPNFMAPEQAAGRIEEQDQRTDIFALGGILYNILTLHTPVRGDTVGELLGKIQRGYIPPPVYYNRRREIEVNGERQVEEPNLPHCPGGQVPESLSAVAMKALAVKQEDRYQNVAELQQEIEAYGGGFATFAEQASIGKQMWLLVKRRKMELGLAAAALLLITALSAGFLVKIVADRKQLQKTVADLRQTALPRYQLARSLVEERNFNAALREIDSALELQPDNAGFLALKGNLLQTLFRLKEARDVYKQVILLNPQQPYAANNLKLCEKLLKDSAGSSQPSPAAVEELRQAMLVQQRTAEAMAFAATRAAGTEQDFQAWKAQLEKAGIKGNLTRGQDGRLNLSFEDPNLKDLSALKDMPLTYLVFKAHGITDLSPLRGKPLATLSANTIHVRDLTPLMGMPLTSLAIMDEGRVVSDISPLRGLRLHRFDLYYSIVSDLSPLQGMPLTDASLTEGRFTDLSPLAGAPLKSLYLAGARVADLRPLKGLPLERLAIENTPVTTIAPLAETMLTDLVLEKTTVRDLSPVKGMPLKSLRLAGSPVGDVSVLGGMATLESLDLSDTKVNDLSALRGLRLQNLGLSGLLLKDLSVLQGMPLRELYLDRTRIADLRPLAGLPLQKLRLDSCASLKDLSPLVDCPQLEAITLPTTATNLEVLRQLPKLRWIGYSTDRLRNFPATCAKAEDFWKAYDARKKPAKTN